MAGAPVADAGRWPRWAARAGGWPTPAGAAAIAAGALLLVGMLLRPLRLYSDIIYLYGRDQLWLRPVPYLGYPLEYPVLTGWFTWLFSYVPGKWGYFFASALALAACGVGVAVLVARAAPGHRWLVALAPSLVFYGSLNWDLLGIVALVAALVAYGRGRALAGTTLLAVATWAKFFPIVVVPLLVAERLGAGRPRDAARLAAWFAALSAAINLPFAVRWGADGWSLRPGWLFFFTFNQRRRVEPSIWSIYGDWTGRAVPLDVVNRWSAVLLVLGAGGLGALVLWRARRLPRGAAWSLALPGPAVVAMTGWWFFINKVYSPQYSLWLVVLLALAAAPRRLCLAWLAVDVLYFTASFTVHLSWNDYIFTPILLIREVGLIAVTGWAVWQVARGEMGGREPELQGVVPAA